ncbi:MAG: hypothetical protein KJO07_12710 [Deltaproteobacteria bacterium]|nr:hypothetical protein [Deltaproteobacteria bacterium]
MKRPTNLFFVLATAAVVSACAGEVELSQPSGGTEAVPPGPSDTVGDEDSTFDHDNSGVDPFDLLERIEVEGPPIYAARMHGCSKVRYRTLGNMLASLGASLEAIDPVSAGSLYRTGFNALGGPNYPARVRENVAVTTSAASRAFDIFAAAAPEIIANISAQPRCQIDGVGPEIFDESGACTEAGVTCLLGVPATAQHLEICDLTVNRATSAEVGRELAVATLLAAAHTCE